ncbi:MAG: AAA family ATPase, partial [Kofleriaceae bacterium]|nr:AAA family ATPase [Kofleriaceae bacterium]
MSISLEPNRYVGREEDLIALAQCYERLDRLVTIVGPPGTGKSRLARHYAHIRAKRTDAQTYFFDLTDAASADDVSNVVARVLGLSAHGATTDLNVGQLGHALDARGPALFVFDNFEHVVSSAAVILVRWLETAAQGHFLVTSRELLRVSGETAYELLPLRDDHAIDLFLDRVRTVRSDYVPTDEEQPDLLAIVRALDCIPLALELAATRMSILSPAQLRSRLHERFKVLSKGPRNAGKR